jgi:hypothetical protein
MAFATKYTNRKFIKKIRLSKIGSIEIIAQVNLVSYRLELPPTIHIHPIFHVFLLEPYKIPQIPSRIPPAPPPIEIDHDMEYEVEDILDSYLQHRRLEYFIH